MVKELETEVELSDKEGPKKKGFPAKPVILAALGILLIGAGVFSWQSGLFAQLLGNGEGGHAIKSGNYRTKVDIGPIYDLQSFIVNLNEPLGKRYLKLKVDLELDSEESMVEINKRLPQFRDTVLTLLSSKSFADISDLTGKYQLRAEMLSQLNSFMSKGKIRNVYFTEFIVQ